MGYIVVSIFAFIVGILLGQDIERGKYLEKIQAMKALVKRNDKILEAKEKEVDKQKKEILNLYEYIDNALTDKKNLIEMLDKLISKIHIEPYMEFTAQSTTDLEKLANDYAIEYLGLTKEKIADFKYAEDYDINKLQLKYATALINNVLIADLDRKYITDYLTQSSKSRPMPESKKLLNKEIDAEFDKRIKKDLNNISANPIFNPDVVVPLFKIGLIYTQRGINNFAGFSEQMIGKGGERIKPWIKPTWNMIASYQGNDLDEKILTASFRYVGYKWEYEGKSLNEIKNDLEELIGKEQAKQYIKYIEIAYNGVQTYFAQKEEEINQYDNLKLIKYWKNICKEKNKTIVELNKIIISLNEDNSNTWKNKYEELNKKYIQTHDEVIYLRRTYDKEHAKLISLENELEIAHKKIIELQKNNLQKYRKEDIENINDWRKFEQFIAKQFKIKNFKVILTPRTNDGGKDIIIEKNDIKTYIECKYWNSNKTIGREEIQKLAGAAMMDGVKNAIFITTSTYNENAFETARALNKNGFNINLWTTKDLLAFINK